MPTETELAKKRLKAQEVRLKTNAIYQQTKQDTRKNEQSRYGIEKSQALQESTELPQGPYTNTQQSMDVDARISTIKSNVKKLNPHRRAWKTHTLHTGENNPNIPGQDNGLNAWMDVNLNNESTDHNLRIDASYAKRNSDNSRFYDVDHIPIQGPPPRDDFPDDMSVADAAAITERLLNDNNLYTCRRTGIMRQKQDQPRRNQPQSTVTKVQHARDTQDRKPVKPRKDNYRSR